MNTSFDLYLPVPFDQAKNIAGPDFIRIFVTPAWLDLVERRVNACRDLGFTSSEAEGAPDYSDDQSSEKTIVSWRVWFSHSGFKFIATTMAHDDIATDLVPLAALLEVAAELAAGKAPAGSAPFARGIYTGYAGALFTGASTRNSEVVAMVRERFPELAAVETHHLMAQHIAGSSPEHSPVGERWTRMRV